MKQLEIGCYPAPVTPFSKKGAFMADAFAEILRWHIACGSKGFLIAGDNGENWALDLKELREITEIAMREAELFAIRMECEALYACEPLQTLW